MSLIKHVMGQKKTAKIQRSLEIAVVSAQNIAHKMEAPVRFRVLWSDAAAGNNFSVSMPIISVAIEGV
jgi:hypothetical protein